MTVHASKELLEAMLGKSPMRIDRDGNVFWYSERFDFRVCDGKRTPYGSVQAATADYGEDTREFDCPGCLKAIRASLPEETLVRLDYLETRLPTPRCPSCDFGPFIPMREADGFNHRAVAGSTHVCTACGKGWRP